MPITLPIYLHVARKRNQYFYSKCDQDALFSQFFSNKLNPNFFTGFFLIEGNF